MPIQRSSKKQKEERTKGETDRINATLTSKKKEKTGGIIIIMKDIHQYSGHKFSQHLVNKPKPFQSPATPETKASLIKLSAKIIQLKSKTELTSLQDKKKKEICKNRTFS